MFCLRCSCLNPTVVVLKRWIGWAPNINSGCLNPTVVVLKLAIKRLKTKRTPMSQSNRSGFETGRKGVFLQEDLRSQSNRSGFETSGAGSTHSSFGSLNPTVVVLKLQKLVARHRDKPWSQSNRSGFETMSSTLAALAIVCLNPTVVVLKLQPFLCSSRRPASLNPTVVVLKLPWRLKEGRLRPVSIQP